MQTLYLECNMGAAGDMLMAALLELHPAPEDFLTRLRGLGLPNVTIEREPAEKCGIQGSHMKILVKGKEEESQDVGHGHHHSHDGEEHHHTHHHSHDEEEHHHTHHHHSHTHTGMAEIEKLVSALELPEKVRQDVLQIYHSIAEAEGHAHGKPIEQIHFHEVGTMDAVTDIVGVCLLLHELAPDRIVASPVHTGSGQVRCAHGILPVPAPATAYLLQGIPAYGGEIKGELCTPTGAALLKHFVLEFGPMPVMRLKKTGYGMGKKDFPVANCLRAMLGDTEDSLDSIVELCCNLDDITPEQIGYATEELMKEGALDVYTTAIQMKKNRPGVLLTCMCKEKEKEKFLHLLFKHTTTLGIREYSCRRYGLTRVIREKETPYGTVRVKEASGYGVERGKIEYEDLARLAREQGCSFAEMRDKL